MLLWLSTCGGTSGEGCHDDCTGTTWNWLLLLRERQELGVTEPWGGGSLVFRCLASDVQLVVAVYVLLLRRMRVVQLRLLRVLRVRGWSGSRLLLRRVVGNLLLLLGDRRGD